MFILKRLLENKLAGEKITCMRKATCLVGTSKERTTIVLVSGTREFRSFATQPRPMNVNERERRYVAVMPFSQLRGISSWRLLDPSGKLGFPGIVGHPGTERVRLRTLGR